MEPDVGVDHYDVTWVEGGLQVARAGPVALWWWSEVPSLDTCQLGLPGWEEDIVNMKVCPWTWSA